MNRLMIAALSLSLLTGCQSELGGAADGRFEYTSTVHTPYTVKLMDTSTGETLWTFEVPIGRTLSVRFLQGHDSEATGQDTMKWELFPTKRVGQGLANAMPCPPASSRILKVYLRDQPEPYPTESPIPKRPSVAMEPSAAVTPKPAAATAPDATKPAGSSSMVVPPDPNQPAPSETKTAEPVPVVEPER